MIEALRRKLENLDSRFIEDLTNFAISNKIIVNDFLNEALILLTTELNNSKEFGDNPFTIKITEHKIGLIIEKLK